MINSICFALRDLDAAIDIHGRGVLANRVEDCNLNRGFEEIRWRGRRGPTATMPLSVTSRIRRAAEIARQFSDALESVLAEDHARPRLRIKAGGVAFSNTFDRAALVEELEHVALVRLVPRDLHRGDRAEVEALDQRRVEQLLDERGVLGDRGDDQRRADLREHLALRHFDDTRIGAEVFPVGERVRERIAMHDRRAQIDAALELHLARAVAILRGHVRRAGCLQAVLDRARR